MRGYFLSLGSQQLFMYIRIPFGATCNVHPNLINLRFIKLRLYGFVKKEDERIRQIS